MPLPLPDDVREAIATDIRDGWSRNEIARRNGVSVSSVTKISKLIGPPSDGGEWFDRAQTKKATAAMTADLKAQRARIVKKILDAVERSLDQLERPYVVYNFGGKDNTYNEKLMTEPPTQAKKDLMTIVGIGSQRALELIKFDAQGADSEHVGLLQEIGAALVSRFGDGSARVVETGDEN